MTEEGNFLENRRFSIFDFELARCFGLQAPRKLRKRGASKKRYLSSGQDIRGGFKGCFRAVKGFLNCRAADLGVSKIFFSLSESNKSTYKNVPFWAVLRLSCFGVVFRCKSWRGVTRRKLESNLKLQR